ncbi:MAG TPA: hypothetical protein VEW26_07275 [Allosphingosinicella sp.]|nr:hypothetical protein [Allosphingosinicella sp.]
MTVSRENLDVATEGTTGQREWVRPVVQQLTAGAAEDSSGPAVDAIINPS